MMHHQTVDGFTAEEVNPLLVPPSQTQNKMTRRRQGVPVGATTPPHPQGIHNLYSSSTSPEDFSANRNPATTQQNWGRATAIFHDVWTRFVRTCYPSRTNCLKCRTFVCSKPPLDHPEQEYYYEDTFNDDSWACSIGTDNHEPQHGIWLNIHDQVGTWMGTLVWILMLYSVLTISLLATASQTNNTSNNNDDANTNNTTGNKHYVPTSVAMMYGTICALALACHAKTTFTDPGSIPSEAVPREVLFRRGVTTHAMCSHCQTYKPPLSHHCRICNRCVSRMDHHCPWMNNCIGANNFKHFILFLLYTWIGCLFALVLFALNYFFCGTEDCTFDPILIQLVRVMTVLCIVTWLFVSSMIMNVTYGIMTGVGTIDRLKKKAHGTSSTVGDDDVIEPPIGLKDIFGIQGYWTWIFPVDPVFEDYDHVMGYSVPARLVREQTRTDEHHRRHPPPQETQRTHRGTTTTVRPPPELAAL